MLAALRVFREDERGATAIEYGVLASLIVIVIIAAVSATADATTALFDTIATHVGTSTAP